MDELGKSKYDRFPSITLTLKDGSTAINVMIYNIVAYHTSTVESKTVTVVWVAGGPSFFEVKEAPNVIDAMIAAKSK